MALAFSWRRSPKSPGLRNARALAVIRGRNASFAAASSRTRRRAASRARWRAWSRRERVSARARARARRALASATELRRDVARGSGEGVASSAAPPRDRPDPGTRLGLVSCVSPRVTWVNPNGFEFGGSGEETERGVVDGRAAAGVATRAIAAAPASAAPASARAISRSCALGEYGETCDRAAARESASDAGALFVVGVPIGAAPPPPPARFRRFRRRGPSLPPSPRRRRVRRCPSALSLVWKGTSQLPNSRAAPISAGTTPPGLAARGPGASPRRRSAKSPSRARASVPAIRPPRGRGAPAPGARPAYAATRPGRPRCASSPSHSR